jgi:hypothetical protein
MPDLSPARFMCWSCLCFAPFPVAGEVAVCSRGHRQSPAHLARAVNLRREFGIEIVNTKGNQDVRRKDTTSLQMVCNRRRGVHVVAENDHAFGSGRTARGACDSTELYEANRGSRRAASIQENRGGNRREVNEIGAGQVESASIGVLAELTAPSRPSLPLAEPNHFRGVTQMVPLQGELFGQVKENG